MTPSRGHDDEQFASAASVAGLAREVEQLSRKLKGLDDLPGRVKQLARTVTQLAAEVAQGQASGTSRDAAVSWLDLPGDVELARQLLDDLVGWMDGVYLRYVDAATHLPNCWLWHPDVVEELLWLKQAWDTAYRSDEATVAMAADWHDRYRPGVVRRIEKLARNCSLEKHDRRDGETPSSTPIVPVVSAVPAVSRWWGSDRYGYPPQPTEEQFAEDSDVDRWGGGRR